MRIVGLTVRLLRHRVPVPDPSQFGLASAFRNAAELVSP
jgi:hypothetical protein